MVVDETAIEDHAAVRRQRARDDVGRVGVRAAVGRWTDAPFGIGLQDEAAEVGNRLDRARRRAPSTRRSTRWIERVEGVEPAERLRAAEIDRKRQPHAPRPQDVGDTRDLRDEPGRQHERVRVDVVDRDAVDAERRQQPAVLADAAQVVADVAALPEDRAPAVAALDRCRRGCSTRSPSASARRALASRRGSSSGCAERELAQHARTRRRAPRDRSRRR